MGIIFREGKAKKDSSFSYTIRKGAAGWNILEDLFLTNESFFIRCLDDPWGIRPGFALLTLSLHSWGPIWLWVVVLSTEGNATYLIFNYVWPHPNPRLVVRILNYLVAFQFRTSTFTTTTSTVSSPIFLC